MRYDFNGNALQCVLSYKNEKRKREHCELKLFGEHPALLQAIFESKKVRLKREYSSFFPQDKELVVHYHLSGVTVPGNYVEKTIIGHSDDMLLPYTFESNKSVYKAIRQKHKEQQRGYTAE